MLPPLIYDNKDFRLKDTQNVSKIIIEKRIEQRVRGDYEI